MKQLIFFCTLFFFSFQLSAQTQRMDNSKTGRTYTVENLGQTNLLFLQEAERNYRNFEFESTLFALENAVAQNPYSPEALILRARFKKRMGMLTEAEADLEMARRINPYVANLYGYDGNSGLLTILSMEPGRSMENLSPFHKFNYYYRFIDNEMMSNEDIQNEIVLLEKAIDEIEMGELEDAQNTVDTLLSIDSSFALAHDLKGIILTKQENYETARQAFLKAVALKPDFAIAWYNLGQVERKLGNFQQAKNYLDRAISLQDDLTKAYFERAEVLKSMGDKENALEDYNKIITLNGDVYMQAFLNRGLTKKMLGDYGGALSDLNLAIKEFPDNPELRKNRGNIQMLFGLHRKAIDDYTKAIEQNNEYAEAYFNRALAHFLIYDKISGCADLEKSAALGFEKAMDAQQYFCGE